MIYKKERNRENLARYAAEQEGTLQTQDGLLEYRLTYLPELALHGEREILEREIRDGAPRLGLDMDILWLMKEPMYLRKGADIWQGNCFSGIGWQFYTTLDAAVYGGQYETLQMLLAKGARFDLRSKRLREMYYHCPDERILRLAFEKKEYHAEVLEIDRILQEREEANLRLLEVLYQQGFRPVKNILDLYVQQFYGWHDEKRLEKDPVVCFFQEKGYRRKGESEEEWGLK